MKLSVIIPAYNEEKLIRRCVESVSQAFETHASKDWTGDVIVADNNSSDRTAELARQAGARVVFEPVNQISRARNAGARAAEGDWLLFIDADSVLAPETLLRLLDVVRQGQVAGGGCLIGLDAVPPLGALGVEFWNLVSRLLKWAPGSFLFCRADAFRDIGGFTTELFAAEEIPFSRALKRWAKRKELKTVILTGHRHISSGRKFRLYSRAEWVRHFVRCTLLIRWTLRDHRKLGFYYDGRR